MQNTWNEQKKSNEIIRKIFKKKKKCLKYTLNAHKFRGTDIFA